MSSWDLREPECLTQARLMVAAPEFVYDQLEFYSKNVESWEGKEELEKLLLTRNEKLINLALAQFATDHEIVQQLYDQARVPTEGDEGTYNLGLRVACLSNRHLYPFNWPDAELNALMAKGYTTEAAALLKNPSIASSVLEALFKKTECFAQVDEKNWLSMIQASAQNEQLNIDQSNEFGPDLSLWAIHKAIFQFLETAPVTSQSAHTALALLGALDTEHTRHARPDDIAPVLERWGKAELENYKGEDREGRFTHLPLREELRCLIASLYNYKFTDSGRHVFGSRDDKDIARRCAFYAGTDLSEKDIETGYNKDEDVFVFAVLKNRSVLLNKKKRARIEEKLSGYLIHEYRRRCEDIRKQYKHFDISPVSEMGRGLLDDFEQESNKEMSLLEKISAQNEQLAARLKGYEWRIYWIVVILIVAMYLIVKR